MRVWRNRYTLKNEDTNRLARPHDRTAPIRGYFWRDLNEPHPIEPLTTLIGDADPTKSQSEGRILGRFASPWSAARCAARSETDTVLDQNDEYKVWKVCIASRKQSQSCVRLFNVFGRGSLGVNNLFTHPVWTRVPVTNWGPFPPSGCSVYG